MREVTARALVQQAIELAKEYKERGDNDG